MKIAVASPCSESWDGMAGDDRMRFCGRCRRNVYNLSAMTDGEAAALAGRPDGPPCVRFYQRRDGTVMTRDCPVGWRRKIAIRAAVAATLLLGLLAATTAAGSDGSGDGPPRWIQAVLDWLDPRPQVTMGSPCVPPRPPGP